MRQISFNHFPIYSVYYCFSCISFILRVWGIQPNYEPYWILLFIIMPFVASNRMINKQNLLFLFVILIAFTLKYILPFLYVSMSDIAYRALLIDGKWIIYILLVVLWGEFVGYPSIRVLYRAGVFFSKIFIVFSILRFATVGLNIRPGLIGEANYDGLLILIPFCFIKSMQGGFKDYIVFFIGTLCTGSRTGIVCMFVLLTIIIGETRPKFMCFFIPIVIGFIVAIFTFRGFNSIESIDRYIFYEQAITYFQNADVNSILFGSFPGTKFDMPVLNSFTWYISKFEGENNINGIFPFYFHATYIRLAMTWGLPILFFIILCVIFRYFKIKYLPLRLLIIVALLQSVALSVLTLVNVSAILFFAIFMAIRASKTVS